MPQNMNQKLHVTLDSTDPVCSFNLTQQFPSMLPYMHQNLNFTAGSDFTDLLNQTQQFPNVPQVQNFIPDSTPTSVSLNQGQVFVSSSKPTQGINYTVAQCSAMPDANKFLTEIIGGDSGVDATAHAAPPPVLPESQHQHSSELANLLKVLDNEADATRGSGIEPHPDNCNCKMESRDPSIQTGERASSKEEEMPLRKKLEIFQQKMHALIDKLMARTFELEANVLSNNKILTEIYGNSR
ncbi:Uncharacterized protein TCM_009385 [Theobroma cacao]|uniref:Uncharacterized protein n=1 Tax=Theobroma cacao TaxID=3641 RepID=A0A061E4S3_THECC|nr:Uncharacterized protein TCM_009385 [Theobroma cacao]